MEIKSAWLTTNRSCNCRCEWCYAQKTLERSKYMDFEKAQIAIQELKKCHVKKIVLIGGEPTIYKHFLELVRYIRENDINCTVATNGIAFANLEFSKDTIKAGVNNINISLKAASEDEYVKYTGTKSLGKVLKGYRNLKQIGFKPVISYVIVNDNQYDFDRLVDLLERNHIDHVGFQFVKPVLELNQTTSIMDLRKMASFVDYIYMKMKHTQIKYSIEVSFPLCLINKHVLDNMINEKKIVTCCHVQRGSGIVFDTDFKVLPCNHFAEYPFTSKPIDFSVEKPIEKLWESKSVSDFRRTSRCYPSEKCFKCEYWNICGGGCFTRWLFINPKDYIDRK